MVKISYSIIFMVLVESLMASQIKSSTVGHIQFVISDSYESEYSFQFLSSWWMVLKSDGQESRRSWSTALSPPLFVLNLCSLSVMKQKVRAYELEDHQKLRSGTLLRPIMCFDFSVSFGETFLYPHRSFQTTLPNILEFIPHLLCLKSPHTKDYLFNTGSWEDGTNIPLAYLRAKRYYY